MGDGLLLINTFISIVTLALVSVLLYLQLRKPAKKKVAEDQPSEDFSEELMPSFSFYNGKLHNNGIVSMKLKNSGGNIKEISFNPGLDNIEFRCGTESLDTGQETTISLVPMGFNFTDDYFNSNKLTFAVKYKSILNDYVDENYRIESPSVITKIS